VLKTSSRIIASQIVTARSMTTAPNPLSTSSQTTLSLFVMSVTRLFGIEMSVGQGCMRCQDLRVCRRISRIVRRPGEDWCCLSVSSRAAPMPCTALSTARPLTIRPDTVSHNSGQWSRHTAPVLSPLGRARATELDRRELP